MPTGANGGGLRLETAAGRLLGSRSVQAAGISDRLPSGRTKVRCKEPWRRIAPKAVDRFKERVRELTGRTRGVSVERMAEDLSQYLRGWIGYFGKCETPSVLQGLERWIRHRLRSMVWKQWKRGTVRFAELRKRGVGRDLAAQTAGSAHGPWRLANSPALSLALPNAYYDSLGIPRLTVSR